MSNKPQQPRPNDAVLGNQSQTSIDAAVLGGIEGIRQQLAIDNLEVKKVALTQALNYGEKGIDILFEILEQPESWEIQWLAYSLLEMQPSKIIKARLKNHFPWYEFESVTLDDQGKIIKRVLGRAKYYRENLGNGIYLDMVYIPAGKFLMGSSNNELQAEYREKPQHQVTLREFYLGKYPVTQEQYKAVMGYNPSRIKDNLNKPVEQISWDKAQSFCQKLIQKTGKDYRLPTEAEWEYSCRAGTISPYYCGDVISTEQANYKNRPIFGFGKGTYRKTTTPVGSFSANGFGLYDMHGNVLELCEDHFHESYEHKPENLKQNGNIAWLSPHETRRVMRGGCWEYGPQRCRSATRIWCKIDNNGFDIDGFRLALSI